MIKTRHTLLVLRLLNNIYNQIQFTICWVLFGKPVFAGFYIQNIGLGKYSCKFCSVWDKSDTFANLNFQMSFKVVFFSLKLISLVFFSQYQLKVKKKTRNAEHFNYRDIGSVYSDLWQKAWRNNTDIYDPLKVFL